MQHLCNNISIATTLLFRNKEKLIKLLKKKQSLICMEMFIASANNWLLPFLTAILFLFEAEDICRLLSLLIWASFIGKFFHPVGGGIKLPT